MSGKMVNGTRLVYFIRLSTRKIRPILTRKLPIVTEVQFTNIKYKATLTSYYKRRSTFQRMLLIPEHSCSQFYPALYIFLIILLLSKIDSTEKTYTPSEIT